MFTEIVPALDSGSWMSKKTHKTKTTRTKKTYPTFKTYG
jgi:hypothetical protein